MSDTPIFDKMVEEFYAEHSTPAGDVFVNFDSRANADLGNWLDLLRYRQDNTRKLFKGEYLLSPDQARNKYLLDKINTTESKPEYVPEPESKPEYTGAGISPGGILTEKTEPNRYVPGGPVNRALPNEQLRFL